MGVMPKTKKPKTNDASLCILRGWRVGDILKAEPTERICDLSAHRKFVRITAIGEESILVRERDGQRWLPERRWSRHLLDWAITLARPRRLESA